MQHTGAVLSFIYLLVFSMIYTLVVSLCASVLMFSSYYLLSVYLLYTLWKNIRLTCSISGILLYCLHVRIT